MCLIFLPLEIYASTLLFQSGLRGASLQKEKRLKTSMHADVKKGKGSRTDRLLAKMTKCSIVLERLDSDKGVKVSLGEIQAAECFK